MSNYRNFITAFPQRCKDILDITEEPARVMDREVTLLLMVASAGLVVPYERLKPDSRFVLPSGDRNNLAGISAALDELLKKPFLNSSLWPDVARLWSYGKLQSVRGDPEDWPELHPPKPVPADTTVGSIVHVIRTGLAHGNIFTRAGENRDIDALIFVSGGYDTKMKKEIPLKYVYVTPLDFRAFLLQWFAFLESTVIPQTIMLDIVAQPV